MIHKFCGVYNWKGENHTMYTTVPSKTIAHRNFCVKLAKELGISRWSVSAYFNSGKDNHSITSVNEDSY